MCLLGGYAHYGRRAKDDGSCCCRRPFHRSGRRTWLARKSPEAACPAAAPLLQANTLYVCVYPTLLWPLVTIKNLSRSRRLLLALLSCTAPLRQPLRRCRALARSHRAAFPFSSPDPAASPSTITTTFASAVSLARASCRPFFLKASQRISFATRCCCSVVLTGRKNGAARRRSCLVCSCTLLPVSTPSARLPVRPFRSSCSLSPNLSRVDETPALILPTPKTSSLLPSAVYTRQDVSPWHNPIPHTKLSLPIKTHPNNNNNNHLQVYCSNPPTPTTTSLFPSLPPHFNHNSSPSSPLSPHCQILSPLLPFTRRYQSRVVSPFDSTTPFRRVSSH